jgi:hypothetical protein
MYFLIFLNIKSIPVFELKIFKQFNIHINAFKNFQIVLKCITYFF